MNYYTCALFHCRKELDENRKTKWYRDLWVWSFRNSPVVNRTLKTGLSLRMEGKIRVIKEIIRCMLTATLFYSYTNNCI